MPEDKLRRPLTIQSPHPDKRLGALNIRSPDCEEARPDPAPLIPPPPAKHAERERFFREKSIDGVASLPDHLRGLSQHSRDGSRHIGFPSWGCWSPTWPGRRYIGVAPEFGSALGISFFFMLTCVHLVW